MVVDLDNEDRADALLHALADRTRRDILRQSMTGGNSVSGLATRYSMSFAAVQKHVAVLERATLVTKERHGREQLVRTNIASVREASRILDELETLWRGRLGRLDALLVEATAPASTHIEPTTIESTTPGDQR